MLLSHNREKLINAILFFATNTRFCGKTKLFKLLYFLDFEHFRLTGRSVTGLDYYAWPKGPVPVDLFAEFEVSEPDMAEKVLFRTIETHNGLMYRVEPLVEFDSSHFSKREMTLFNKLAQEYQDARAEDMVEATHLENLPWHRVFQIEGRRQKLIPYEYALNRQEEDEMKRIAIESKEIRKNYQ